jgi:hypothetical protein
MKAGDKFFLLTPKGVEELRGKASKLDANARNFLSLIEQGYTTAEVILQRFVATATSDGTTPAAAPEATPSVADSMSERLRLKPGVSPSQARFVLSNFCLDQFGTQGKDFADAVEFCADVPSLQLALDNIRTEVKKLCPERRPALVACVREINDTDY